jgi:RHS repeat-associated protein
LLLASIGSLRGVLFQSVVSQIPEDNIFYFINDHLDTPVMITDKNEEVVWKADFKPFGEADVTIEDVQNNFRFPGQYYDNETELHYNWHRYYNPTTGRYLTPDPIGLIGGINLYFYAIDNPVNAFDPFGLINWGAVGKGGLASIGGGFTVAGGALVSTTGVGAVGGVPAVLVGTASFSWGISQIIAGLMENELPFMGTKEAIIKGATEEGLLQDELLGLNTLTDMLATGRVHPSDIKDINSVIQNANSILNSGGTILDSVQSDCN